MCVWDQACESVIPCGKLLQFNGNLHGFGNRRSPMSFNTRVPRSAGSASCRAGDRYRYARCEQPSTQTSSYRSRLCHTDSRALPNAKITWVQQIDGSDAKQLLQQLLGPTVYFLGGQVRPKAPSDRPFEHCERPPSHSNPPPLAKQSPYACRGLLHQILCSLRGRRDPISNF